MVIYSIFITRFRVGTESQAVKLFGGSEFLEIAELGGGEKFAGGEANSGDLCVDGGECARLKFVEVVWSGSPMRTFFDGGLMGAGEFVIGGTEEVSQERIL